MFCPPLFIANFYYISYVVVQHFCEFLLWIGRGFLKRITLYMEASEFATCMMSDHRYMRTHVAFIHVVMHGGQRMTLHMEARIYEPANQGPANRATHGGQRITLHMLQGELAQ